MCFSCVLIKKFKKDYNMTSRTEGQQPIPNVNLELGKEVVLEVEVSVTWVGHKVEPQTGEESQLLNNIETVAQTQLANSSNEIGENAKKASIETNQMPITEALQSKENAGIRPELTLPHASGPASIPSPKGPRGMRYEDLTLPENSKLKDEVVENNLRYASYMYGKLRSKEQPEGGEHGMQITISENKLLYWEAKATSADETTVLLNIAKDLTQEMGFQVDENGNFYHLETGTIFNLVYDSDRKEVNICFMGLGNAFHVKIPKDQQKKLNNSAIKATASSALGKVPKSASQAMEIGSMVRRRVAKSGMKPVMVGHSHGGGLAQAAAISSGSKGVVFNAEPLGSGTKKMIDSQIGKENRKAFSKEVTAFSMKGDWLTDSSINALLCFGRDHGFPVPTVMGKGYKLPTVEGDKQDKHCNFYEAFKSLTTPKTPKTV